MVGNSGRNREQARVVRVEFRQLAVARCCNMATSFAIASCIVQTDEDLGDQSGPARLMARAAAAASITVEILVKWNQVFPIRVVVKHLRIAEHRPLAAAIAEGELSADVFEREPDFGRDVEF